MIDRSVGFSDAIGNKNENSEVANLINPFRLPDRSPESFNGGDRPAPIKWSENIEEKVRESRENGKPLVVYFTIEGSKDCDWCRAMDTSFKDPAVGALAGKANFLKVALRDGVENDSMRLARALDIKAFPTISVLNIEKNGKVNEEARIIGYQSGTTLKANLEKAINPGKKPDQLGDKALVA
ncbi:MAG: thioredoxin family protein [Candidatus Obscuribacterales bacterium]|nr:thioredoxin family protein [Candidatus Obscuribacterales bacterium]